MKTIRFSDSEARAANEEWGFNCGPAALCAALGMTPAEVRPHLLDFERKRYTNPSLMSAILKGMGRSFRQVFRADAPVATMMDMVGHCDLVRVQWGGPWTRPGVPMRVRYRKTHWIVAHRDAMQVYDLNAMNDEHGCDGWLDFAVWNNQLVPWLLKAAQIDGADGTWWPTHILELKEEDDAQAARFDG